MKKVILLLIAPFILFSTLSAQITQKEADDIVKQRLIGETKPYTVYAKNDVQSEGYTVITTTGETVELEYSCWVYFVEYEGETNGKYLIVKASNGNLLEINTKKDNGPGDLPEWRFIPIDIPFSEYSLQGTSCQWTNLHYLSGDGDLLIINSNEELEKYLCVKDFTGGNCVTPCIDYCTVDFSRYTLLLAFGIVSSSSPSCFDHCIGLQQFSENVYEMNVDVYSGSLLVIKYWYVPIITNKLKEGCIIELTITKKNCF